MKNNIENLSGYEIKIQRCVNGERDKKIIPLFLEDKNLNDIKDEFNPLLRVMVLLAIKLLNKSL